MDDSNLFVCISFMALVHGHVYIFVYRY